MKILRILALILLALGGLEVALRLQGQSMVAELLALNRPDPVVGLPPMDAGKTRRALAGSDDQAAHKALRRLILEPEIARQLLPEIEGRAKAGAKELRALALAVLSSLKLQAEPAVPTILKLLHDPSVDVRVAALKAACATIREPLKVLPPPRELLPLLTGPDDPYRMQTSLALQAVTPEVLDGLLRELTKDPDSSRRSLAASNAGRLGPLRDAFVAWWVTVVGHDGSAADRFANIEHAGTLGRGADAWLGVALEDRDPFVRTGAAFARILAKLDGPTSKSAGLVRLYVANWCTCMVPRGEPQDVRELGDEAGAQMLDHQVRWWLANEPKEDAGKRLMLLTRLRCEKGNERCSTVSMLEPPYRPGELEGLLEAMDRSLESGDDLFWFLCVRFDPDRTPPEQAAAIAARIDRALVATGERQHRTSFAYHLRGAGRAIARSVPNLRQMARAGETVEERVAAQGTLDGIDAPPDPR